MLVLLLVGGCVAVRVWVTHALYASLPRTAGMLRVPGLRAPVQVDRDVHGVPSIAAATVDDLLFAQGFVTAQDRLWQMDMLRRHVSGRLAEVLGADLVEHDRTERVLQLRESAGRALPMLPPEQQHAFQRYADGVNAAMAASSAHLPVEFRVLGYSPEPWTALDCLLVGYALVQDLSDAYPQKLNREAVEARLPSDLLSDLYPVGSTHDHPPLPSMPVQGVRRKRQLPPDDDAQAALLGGGHLGDLRRALAGTQCEDCRAGSNNWVVSGAHTASGKPLLANDPHLMLAVPGIWYTAELQAGAFHVAGATVPGIPFVVIGHNEHVAWGFTNSTADVQDVYIEETRDGRYRDAGGQWKPLRHQSETIQVKHGKSMTLDVLLTEHGGVPTPLISPLYPHETRALALRWAIYDPSASGVPLYGVNAANSGTELVEAFRGYGEPSQNLVWADDGGHIGYHLIGRIPLRGDGGSSGLSPVPVRTGEYEWSGYIPYEEMPTVTDPADGVLATANARIVSDGYSHAISLDWGPPYRNERIWTMLRGGDHLSAGDMERMQNDTASELDALLAARIADAVPHAEHASKRARQAAGLLRAWDGRVTKDAVAPNLTEATRRALLPLVLRPYLNDAWELYSWGESSYVLETMVRNRPARWLPKEFRTWDDLLVAALEQGLRDAHAPGDLRRWTWGEAHTLDLEHPVLAGSPWMRALTGVHGSGAEPMEGSAFTVRAFNAKHSASMRFVADLADPQRSTLVLPMGESGNPASGWFMDQWRAWYPGSSLPLPFHPEASASQRMLVLVP